MVSIKFLYDSDSLNVICYTLLVAVTWLSGLLSLDTTLQAKLFWVDNTVSGSKEEGRVEIVMLFVFESFHAILLRYQPSVGLAHLCFRLSSLNHRKYEKYKNNMSLEKVEEIVYTLDLKCQGKWNEQLIFYIKRNKSDIWTAHTNNIPHILTVIIKQIIKYLVFINQKSTFLRVKRIGTEQKCLKQNKTHTKHRCLIVSLVRRVESVCYRVSLKITGTNRIYYCIMIINVFYKC